MIADHILSPPVIASDQRERSNLLETRCHCDILPADIVLVFFREGPRAVPEG